MSVLVVGLNHRTAPTALLERSAVGTDDVPKVLHDLVSGAHVAEAVLLSTCNRTEVYAEVETFHGGVTEVSDQLARISGLALDDLTAHLYVHHEARAVAHLFSVAGGLDSMLVGETQILGQVRAAYRVSQAEGGVGRSLAALFQTALRVGKRAHSETGIDAAGSSIVSVGIQLAAAALTGDDPAGERPAGERPAGEPATFGGTVRPGLLADLPVLLIGAGAVGALAGAIVRRAGGGDLAIANRGAARAERLAATLNGRATGLAGLVDELAVADLVVSSTGATGLVLPYEVVAAAAERRGGRPLVLLDLALPRDVDPAVRELPGVTVIDLETLRDVLEGQQVGQDVEAVRTMIAGEVVTYGDRRRAQRVAPTVVALRAQAAEVVGDELTRLRGRIGELDPKTWAAIEGSVRRVADKLLHAPTVRVQALAEAPGGDSYAEALRELFGLPRDAPTVVSAPDLREVT
ncbi:MAG: glutamyl-tRNA reductase [Frankia sp.]